MPPTSRDILTLKLRNLLHSPVVTPKISIIVPIYNVESKLAKCLDTILAQTFSDFELCLVNDGSKDKSLQVCQDYAKHDARISVYDINNCGAAEARNYGLEHTSAPFVMFIDSDDWLELNMVEVLHRHICTGSETDFACCGHYVELQHGERFQTSVPYSPELVEEPFASRIQQGIALLEKSRRFPLLWDKIYRRELIEQHHVRFEKQFVTGQDCDFNIKYFRHVRQCVITNQPLYHYRKEGTGSLCARYKDNLYEMLSELNRRKAALYAELGMKDNEEFWGCYRDWAVANLQVCVPNMFRSNSPLTFGDKRRQFQRLFQDEFLRKNISSYRPKDRLGKFFRCVYAMKSSTFAVMLYSCLFFIRNRAEPLYQFLRRK